MALPRFVLLRFGTRPATPLPADCVRVPRVCLEIPAAPSGLHAMTCVEMLARTVMPACSCAALALWVGEGVSCWRACIYLRPPRRSMAITNVRSYCWPLALTHTEGILMASA